MKKIGCKDLGSACGFEADAPTLDRLVPRLEDHARDKHGLPFLSVELEDEVRRKAEEREEAETPAPPAKTEPSTT